MPWPSGGAASFVFGYNSPPGDFVMSLSLPDLTLLTDNISHSAVLASTLVVALAEIGDKTQLLSLLLAIKFRNKLAIVMGILVATLLNHAASAWLGVWLGESLNSWMNSDLARWLLAGGFIAMALWILIPDKEDDDTDTHQAWGAFLATTFLFFLAEIGDKTQVATVLLGAEFSSVLWVTVGTTLGMMLANVPVVIFGEQLMRRMPMKAAHYLTSILFIAMAIWVVLG